MLVAGYDTTAQTLSYCAYELVKNPDIQKRLQEEIDDVIEQNGGDLPDYNQTQGMEYLDMVLHETLVTHAFTRIKIKLTHFNKCLFFRGSTLLCPSLTERVPENTPFLALT